MFLCEAQVLDKTGLLFSMQRVISLVFALAISVQLGHL